MKKILLIFISLLALNTTRAVDLVKYVTSIQDLRNLNTADLYTRVHVAGYYSEGDGGGGIFEWSSASTTVTNYGTILKNGAEDATGRWLRVARTGEPINVKWFGAKGDGSTDDTSRIVSAIAQVGTDGVLYVPGYSGGIYLISGLNVSKSNWSIKGEGTFKCSGTNANFIIVTGNNVIWDGPDIDGDSKAAGGLFINDNANQWTIKGLVVKNIYDDAIAGLAVGYGIYVRKGAQKINISDCVFTNILHDGLGGRVSAGIYITDTQSEYQIKGVSITDCHFDTISPNKEGGCIRVDTVPTYSVGLRVENNDFRNFGRRAGKVIGSGTTWINNYVENYDTNTYSAFSFYGNLNICNNNVIIGEFPKAIEFGSYVAPSGIGMANDNYISFNTTTSETNGIGIELVYRAYSIKAANNIVIRGRMHTFLYGDVQNCSISGSIGTNQTLNGIQLSSDGTNAPVDCRVEDTLIVSSVAQYAVSVGAGCQNVSVVGVSGEAYYGLCSYSAAVTGEEIGTGGGQVIGRRTTNANTSATQEDYLIVVTSSATVTLPAANTVRSGRAYVIKSKSGVTTTVARTGSDTIDEAAANDSLGSKASSRYVSDGVSNWEKL